MKRILFLLALLLTGVFTFTSCKKEDVMTEESLLEENLFKEEDFDGLYGSKLDLVKEIGKNLKVYNVGYSEVEKFRNLNFSEVHSYIDKIEENRITKDYIFLEKKNHTQYVLLTFIFTDKTNYGIDVFYPVSENKLYSYDNCNLIEYGKHTLALVGVEGIYANPKFGRGYNGTENPYSLKRTTYKQPNKPSCRETREFIYKEEK